MLDASSFASTGLGIGLLASSLLLGLRHGIDWDHIAAITDLSATQESPRRGLLLGLLYAAGHAVVVLVIGTITIFAGKSLPDGIDRFFGRVVGVTLILLAIYLLWSLWAHRDDFRMRSRWMIVIGGVRRLFGRTRRSAVEHEHRHAAHADVHHEHDGALAEQPIHTHRHSHAPDDLAADYGPGAATAVGMLHGVGAETPTQVVTFLAASQAGGTGAGLAVLVTFLVGLFLSNTAVTLGATYGFKEAMQRPKVQRVLGAVTAVVSLVIGVLFLLGQDAVLPAFFAG